jgi:hypothetical protein
LLGNSFLSSLDLFFIQKIVISKRYQVLIKLKDKWYSCWDVVFQDLSFGHTIQVLHDSSERISMSNHNHIFIIENSWTNCIMPERQDSIDCGLQRLCAWESISRQMSILRSKPWMSLVIECERWWWNIVTSSPLENLFLSMLKSCLCLIQSL